MSEHAEEHWGYSPWPFFVNIGLILMLPLAFAFQFVYDMPMAAILCLGTGVPIVVFSVAGWVKECHDDKEAGLAVSAMPYFIVAEAFIFVAFFAAYWVTRLSADQWPPAGTPEHMPVLVPIIMTFTLLASSATIHVAEVKIENDDRAGYIKWLVISIILGSAFLGMSIMEWKHLIHDGFTASTNIYGTSFYSITGFHASHVIVGLAVFLAMLIPALGGRINKTLITAGGIYWHFVDIIWFFVVSQIYFW